MSKAEERALEAYPVVMTTLIPTDDEHPLIEQDCNKFTRVAYIKSYHQAEKDNKLTWEDMRLIDKISSKLLLLKGDLDDKGSFQEVLKRFNEKRKK